MRKRNGLLILMAGMVILLNSCGINSNLMLKTPNDYDKFADELTLIDTTNKSKSEYVLDVNDIFQLRFFTNDGIKVLDISSSTDGSGAQAQLFNPNNSLSYVIQKDSTVKIPVLDSVNLVGMTIREAEEFLEEQYSAHYIDPFVQISVTNRRVIVFPGNGGEAQVLYLANNNTTLMEAIALAGGITERGRASKIKLIRKNDDGMRDVYLIDLSTIEGIAYTDVTVRANDFIYVEPVPQLGREILRELAPIISLITSGAVVISVITSL
ncbi:MAG: polysaccharide biosynthesis/export family protein [Flavobacteriales bacterium]|jgi:polysaccharide export outer membrane protein|nr:polysaccharide biosynthesis/export family protein [Flavobacteriales bacterium]